MKHIVGFSGGIDSQEALAWVRDRFGDEEVIALNSNAGEWEDPLTTEFIHHFSKTVFPIIEVNAIVSDIWADGSNRAQERGLDPSAILTFENMCSIKGRPPSRKAQFCTEILKLKPQRRWIRENFGPTGKYAGEEYERYTGVRREESLARRNYPDREWDEFFDCYVNHPLVNYTKMQCFEGAIKRGEPINPLYSIGFGRVGCAPCINSGKDDILNWLLRRPAMIDKVRGFELKTGQTFFSPMVPGLHLNNIEQVIEWSKTARGGRQQLLPILHEREACESKYGLCE